MTGKHELTTGDGLPETDAMTATDEIDTPGEWLSWLRAALVRAIKTAAQAALASLGAAVTIGEADWRLIAGTAGLGAIASLLTSLVGLPEANEGKSVASIGK